MISYGRWLMWTIYLKKMFKKQKEINASTELVMVRREEEDSGNVALAAAAEK